MCNFKTFALAAALLASAGMAQGQAQLKGRSKARLAPDAMSSAPAEKLAPLPKGTTPFVQKEDNGQVNWTQQFIEAEGEGIIDNERFKNPAQARAMAIRGATVVAQRNLLEIVKGVNVTSETTVEDLITTKDFIVTRIDGVVKGAQMVGQPRVEDGSVKVRLRMPLYAANGLAPAVYDALPEQPTVTPPPADQQPAVDTAAAQAPAAPAQTPTNGFALNMNGKPFDPALFPVIVDEQGKVVLDTKKIYDPSKGQFPQILNASKTVLQAMGNKKGVQILDVLSAADGKITISNDSKNKVVWDKVFNVAKTIGKFLLMLI